MADPLFPLKQLNPELTAQYVSLQFLDVFPGQSTDFIPELLTHVEALFAGKKGNYLPLDTKYHDLEHTLQATACLTHLLTNYQRSQVEPPLTPFEFELALTAIVLHDTGYLKETKDHVGTGAKYTHIHEFRSCQHAQEWLKTRDWAPEHAQAIKHLILSTGPKSKLDTIAFQNPKERLLGFCVCTADFISQMADPSYPRKLPHLYSEFEESFEFIGLGVPERPYNSAEDLLQTTPYFWENFVLPRLQIECENVLQFLADPVTGKNVYLEQIEENIRLIASSIPQIKARCN